MSVPRSTPGFVVNVGSATDTTIDAGKPGQKIRVWKLFLENVHASTDVTVTFKTSTGSAALHGGILLKAGGGSWTLVFDGMSWFDTLSGDDLILTTSAAGSIQGVVKYTNERA